MATILREATPIARKDHQCSASIWIIENDTTFSEYTFSERKDILRAKKNNWKIKKGDKYDLQINIWGGVFNVFRAIPAINDICLKYDMYDEP